MFGIFGLGPSELIVLGLVGLAILAGLGVALFLTRDRGPRDGPG
jgi:hypothetical protein